MTRAVGTRHASPSLVANAFHHRSDALSSVAAIGGVGGSLLGFASVDLLAALTVGGMVLRLRWWEVASTPPDDGASSAALDRLEGSGRAYAPRSASPAAQRRAVASGARLRPPQRCDCFGSLSTDSHMGVEVGSDALRQLLRRDRAAPEEPPPSPTATGSTLSSSSTPPASPSGSPSPKKGAEGFELRAARTSGDVARLDETGRLPQLDVPQHLLFDQADQEPPSTTRQRR